MKFCVLDNWPGNGVGLSRYFWVFIFMSAYPCWTEKGPGFLGCSGIIEWKRVAIENAGRLSCFLTRLADEQVT